MMTSRISLEDVVSKGFEELVNNKDDQIKILISPKKKMSLNKSLPGPSLRTSTNGSLLLWN